MRPRPPPPRRAARDVAELGVDGAAWAAPGPTAWTAASCAASSSWPAAPRTRAWPSCRRPASNGPRPSSATKNAFALEDVQHIDVIDIRTRHHADQTETLSALDDATAVMFTGGDQLRLVSDPGGHALRRPPATPQSRGPRCRRLECRRDGARRPHDRARRAHPVLRAGRHPSDARPRHRPGRHRSIRTSWRAGGSRGCCRSLAARPDALGIGIEEGSGMTVSPDGLATVYGPGVVCLVDGADGGAGRRRARSRLPRRGASPRRPPSRPVADRPAAPRARGRRPVRPAQASRRARLIALPHPRIVHPRAQEHAAVVAIRHFELQQSPRLPRPQRVAARGGGRRSSLPATTVCPSPVSGRRSSVACRGCRARSRHATSPSSSRVP